MSAPSHHGRPGRPAAAGLAAALAGACLLATGCAASSNVSAGSAAPMNVHGGAGAAMDGPAFAGRAAAPARLADLPVPAGASIIYTAQLTVRARDVAAAAAQAARLATSAGGYVSNESVQQRGRHREPSASLTLKIPVAAYPLTLASLSSTLGDRLSLSQHAADVTQAVADVSSRAASARAAIAQLRRLLARAGSVAALLGVQDQINQQEANLEALLSQQRALSRQTAFATVTLRLLGPAAAAPVRTANRPAGFAGGLAAGWRALTLVIAWALTGLGALLPFAVLLAALAGIGYLWRRKLAARRAGPRPAG